MIASMSSLLSRSSRFPLDSKTKADASIFFWDFREFSVVEEVMDIAG
jgi:hypothetical protein